MAAEFLNYFVPVLLLHLGVAVEGKVTAFKRLI